MSMTTRGFHASVCMLAFKHEAFIEKAIRSVFSQETNFQIQLVIGEDASPDKTAEIIKIVSSEAPANVEVQAQFNTQNLGMNRNFARALSACTGKYIALLEGDDYWNDRKKLQRQVDFLEANPRFSMCFHPAYIDRGDGKLRPDSQRPTGPESDILELANGNFMQTCSVVFRAGLFKDFPAAFFTSPIGDYWVHMLNAQHGLIAKLEGTMSTYRVHSGGVWSMQPNMDLKILDYIEAMIGHFGHEVDAIMMRRHKAISARSFINRISQEGFQERLARTVRYGDDVLQQTLHNLVESERNLKRHPLGRIYAKIRSKIRRPGPVQ